MAHNRFYYGDNLDLMPCWIGARNVAFIFSVLTLASCTDRPSVPSTEEQEVPALGTIRGDVYLVMQNGDVKGGAGQWLYLVPDGVVDSAVEAACVAYHANRRQALGEEATWRRQWKQEVQRIIARYHRQTEAIERMLADSGLETTERHFGRIDWEALQLERQVELAAVDARVALNGRLPPATEARLAGRTELEIAVVLLTAARDSAKANIDAHFVFDSAPPGDYHIFGATIIGPNRYAWWAPVTVTPGDTIVRDLDNEVEMGDRLFSCQDDPASARANVRD